MILRQGSMGYFQLRRYKAVYDRYAGFLDDVTILAAKAELRNVSLLRKYPTRSLNQFLWQMCTSGFLCHNPFHGVLIGEIGLDSADNFPTCFGTRSENVQCTGYRQRETSLASPKGRMAR